MSKQPDVIVGAGLAGLIAAYAWPNIPLMEVASGPRADHKALLRFRSDAVSRLTGIPFKAVRVHKGIYMRGEFVQPNIAVANAYAQKVIGYIGGDRSIWNIEPATRYVAPEDVYERMIDYASNRIDWGQRYDQWAARNVVINTSPLPVVIEDIIGRKPKEEFHRAPIYVERRRLPGANVYQTVYFPDWNLSVYRASITGDLLIIESMREINSDDYTAMREAFCIASLGEPLETTHQRYGKILPLEEPVRKHLLYRLTHEYNVYNLGRFATWRNVLLDDVVNDIAVIKRMLVSSYDAAKAT